MALSRRSRQPTSINIWPGFVDALTQLVMVIVFVLLVFTVGQFYLSGAVSDQDLAIKKLTQQLNQLSDLLGLERKANSELKLDRATLSANLERADAERERSSATLAATETRAEQAESVGLDRLRQLSQQEVTIATLNQNIDALRQQLTQLAAALDLAQAQNKDAQAKIEDLGTKLNLALATKVEELARYRSEFFGRLKEILGDRPDIRIVGDRFVFQSEVLFQPASAELGEPARQQLTPVVNALREIQSRIPPGLNWILEVDGHTDPRPINTLVFQSNWELSTARAASVVKFLIEQGIPAEHLSAAGFGEFQPLDRANTDEAYRRNRRIELKLTQR
jgi:chemotaxis protein MotB